VHIAGESLLNDGSAIVFFAIFSEMFFLELGIEGLGEDYTFVSGLVKFCRMCFGAFASGLLFAGGLLGILKFLDRRLSREENVVQTAATITIAYLCYYTTDVVWGCSGVIATLVLGVTTRAFGDALVNDNRLLADFWSLVEHLLNTVLFALGGLVWGGVIANTTDRAGSFTAVDWGKRKSKVVWDCV
jgi:NhaP-type Na+/H+ or K+/H+ antiporter